MYQKIELKTPGPNNILDANGENVIRLYWEQADEFPASETGSPGFPPKWQELHNLMDSLKLGGPPIRVHFDTKKMATNAQSVASGYARRTKANYTFSTRLRPNGKSGFWLYMRKIAKDPKAWGVEKRSRQK